MKQKGFALLFLFLCVLARTQAQESPVTQGAPLILFNSFSTIGISPDETRLFKTLIQSYLAEMGELFFNSEEAESPEASSSNADSLRNFMDISINASIKLDHDGPIFNLEITRGSGTTYSLSSAYKTTGELALKARSFLESAFALGAEQQKQAEAKPETLNEQQIIGTWKGENGIEMINLQRRGRGIAFFSSGAQMMLSYSIDNNTLKVRQVSPNSEGYYQPRPLEEARYLAAGAEPMVWVLSMYHNGTALSGTRQATAVKMEFDEVMELAHGGDIRQVQWTKINH